MADLTALSQRQPEFVPAFAGMTDGAPRTPPFHPYFFAVSYRSLATSQSTTFHHAFR